MSTLTPERIAGNRAARSYLFHNRLSQPDTDRSMNQQG